MSQQRDTKWRFQERHGKFACGHSLHFSLMITELAVFSKKGRCLVSVSSDTNDIATTYKISEVFPFQQYKSFYKTRSFKLCIVDTFLRTERSPEENFYFLNS